MDFAIDVDVEIDQQNKRNKVFKYGLYYFISGICNCVIFKWYNIYCIYMYFGVVIDYIFNYLIFLKYWDIK